MGKPVTRRRTRAPDATRQKLLYAAFEEMYRSGFQAASLDAILAKAGVTKGALYHHFPDKAALGYAVVDEVVRAPVLEAYLGRLDPAARDPLSDLQAVLGRRAREFTDASVVFGCPLSNLAQEMSPLDERFRLRLAAALKSWTGGFAAALKRAQAGGTVRRDVDARKVAAFVVAAVEGSFGMAKNARRAAVLRDNLKLLNLFLESLRPAR
jgi:TetR/AcrR family transcriptional regulator, transcriptional repressor for nem operon